MFTLNTSKLSKHFGKQWLFRDLDIHLKSGDRTAILGRNGSGKSTLVKALCGFMAPSSGEVEFSLDNTQLEIQLWHNHFVLAAPYLELIEEYSLQEQIDLHFSLRKVRSQDQLDEYLKSSGLYPHRNKLLRDYSSGMLQRAKLLLAFCTNAEIIFLDEPCSNLDQQGYNWYDSCIEQLGDDQILVVASNQKEEYKHCDKVIDLTEKRK